MTGAKRFRIAIISAFVLAVLLVTACFSVSYAKWEGENAANQATVSGEVGQFYVDVPAQDALPDLDEDTYYFKVDSKSGDPRFYSLSDPAIDDNGVEQCTLTVDLTAGDVITVYKGKTVLSDLGRDWAHGEGEINEITTIANGSFKTKQSAVYRFYYKTATNALFVACDSYNYHLTFTFSGGDTVDAFFTCNGTEGEPYLWLWTAKDNYTGGDWPGYSFSSIESGENKVNVSGLSYKDNGLSFLVTFRIGDEEKSKVPDMVFNTKFQLGYNYLTLGKTTLELKSSHAAPTFTTASTDGSDDVIVRKVSASANADNSFTYKNYVCVKRDYIDDTTVAYVNFSVRQTGEVDPKNVTVTNFTVNRTTTDSSGKLTGSSDSEFVYNSPVNDSLASMNGTVSTKNGRTYIEGGTYLMLYFGEDGDQYYALDVTITTNGAVDFELIARVSDMDRRNAFAEGCGEEYGYYLGGVFNGVDMWDPRAAALLKKNGEYSEVSEELKYTDDGVQKTYYGPSAIDVTLTIDLRAQFDRIKLYRLDETGTREGGKPTLYFVPQNIKKSYKSEAEEGKVVYDEQLNTIVLSPGKYELHFFGNVTYKSNSDYWFDRSTGTLGSSNGGGTVTDIEGESGPKYVAMDNWNGVVENLFIKRLDDEGDDTVEVIFNVNGGTLAGENKIKINWGETFDKPDDPTRDGYSFAGWYTDAAFTDPYDFTKPLTAVGELNLYAKWLDAASAHTVTFHYNYHGAPDDGILSKSNVEDGSAVTAPAADPTRDLYKFMGWVDSPISKTVITKFPAVTDDVEYYAYWEAEKIRIIFNANNWSQADGKDIHIHAWNSTGDLTGGWNNRASMTPLVDDKYYYDLDEVPTGIIFTAGLGSCDGDYRHEVRNPVGLQLGKAYTFTRGGGNTPEPVDPEQYIVAFNATAGSSWTDGSIKHEIKVNENATVTAEIAPQNAPEGKVFVCWSTSNTTSGGAPFDFTLPITNDIILYAQWTNLYTVTFYANGEKWASKEVADGNKVESVAPPTAPEGKVFVCWSTSNTTSGGAAFDFTLPIISNITLYAQWKDKPAGTVTVTFNSNGGSDVESQTFAAGEKATEPDKPTKGTDEFGGWYTDEACTQEFDFNTTVSGDITLHAKWTTPTINTNSYYLIGSFAGKGAAGWDTVDPVYNATKGVKVTFAAGDVFKIVKANSSGVPQWGDYGSGNFGKDHLDDISKVFASEDGQNVKIDVAGDYTVTFNSSTKKISIRKQSLDNYNKITATNGSASAEIVLLKGIGGIYYWNCSNGAGPNAPAKNTSVTDSDTWFNLILLTGTSWGSGQSADLTVTHAAGEEHWYVISDKYYIYVKDAKVTGDGVKSIQ